MKKRSSLNTPITIHAFGGDRAGQRDFRSIHLPAHDGTSVSSAAPIDRDGVRRHSGNVPKLRIGYLEVGCGWLPYWAERMDEEWEKRGKVEAPLCKEETERISATVKTATTAASRKKK